MKKSKSLDANEKAGKKGEDLANIIRQAYVVYLSYKKGSFKIRSPSKARSQSKTRGRSETRGGATERAKSPESAHPKSRGPLVAELRAMAKERGIKDPDKKGKTELRELLGL